MSVSHYTSLDTLGCPLTQSCEVESLPPVGFVPNYNLMSPNELLKLN